MSLMDMFTDVNELSQNLMNGLTLAEVTNTEDPDNLGRVKVKMLLRDSTENETNWARVIVPFAGSTMGMYMIPNVGDVVVIAFLGGHIDKPLVLGGVWSKTSKPPVDNEKGKNNSKIIKTRSGHTITLCDEEGKEKIEVKSSKGAIVTMDDKAETVEIKDSGGTNCIKMDSKGGSVSITADKKLELKAGSTTVTLDGTGNKLEMKSNTVEMKGMQVNVKGDTTLKLESGATLEVKAGAVAQIKGATVTIN